MAKLRKLWLQREYDEMSSMKKKMSYNYHMGSVDPDQALHLDKKITAE